MSNAIRPSDYLTRHTILNLLSDDENARVATVEGGPPLALGEEYVDLEHLSRGVRRMHANTDVTLGHLLPRYAVRETTWAKICHRLGVAVTDGR